MAAFFRPATTLPDDDEIYWVGSAYYFDLAFLQRDWQHPDWRLLPARENPPVAKYLIGLGLLATGQRVESIDLLGCFYLKVEKIPGAWGEGVDYAKRAAVTERMQPALRDQFRRGAKLTFDLHTLIPARRVMLGCALVASWFVFLIGRAMGGGPTGLVASQLLLLHPLVIAAYNHATADAVALMFSPMVAWVAGRCLLRAASGPAWTAATVTAFSLAGGGTLALACGAKMNSLIVALGLGLAVSVAAGRAIRAGDFARMRMVLATGVASLGVALALFVLGNPAIAYDLRAGLAACVGEHRITETIQARFLAGHLTTIPQKLGAVAGLTAFAAPGFGLLLAATGWAWIKGGDVARLVAGWWLLAAVCLTL